MLWRPSAFAAKPTLILKGGFPAWGVVGDPNASIDTAEPLVLGEQFGAFGAVPADLSFLLSNQQALAEGPAPTARRAVAVKGCRTIRASDFISHGELGPVTVAPDGSSVYWRGERLAGEPVARVPLSRLHFW